ncbi:hypothetical protein [Hymenobacter negativus]|uniref:Uncharacterized protein n=1 Tax=Hymenobacter negativus TaxID=2795026 RepID=A0ABS3QB63_9BACT|nr:hypothetical protein [Hymenobacter negativus]MBO2008346.1 hypothetical protein [Hymenobacter negativus]
MPHAVLPCEISPDAFSAYTASWRELVAADAVDALHACFVSNDTRLNYVYLRHEQVVKLVESKPKKICARFALVPRESGTGQSVALVFYSDDANDIPASGYQLSGTAGEAAAITGCATIVSPICFEKACDNINGWGELPANGLEIGFFKTMDEPLRGYTHDVADFEDAIASPAPAALWLIFSLHPERGAEEPNKRLFDTVLTRHVEPDADAPGAITLTADRVYYDVANPCPPACGIIDRA